MGGEILFIEATRMPGKGSLLLTGSLGDVMKESAQTAVSYLRSQAKPLGLDLTDYAKYDLHIHVPAGATPKDGPSAGVTLVAALASLLTQRRVRSDVAMTGEISLRGRVMRVGGIKEKVLAAARFGIKQHHSAGPKPGGLERSARRGPAQAEGAFHPAHLRACSRWRCARNEAPPRLCPIPLPVAASAAGLLAQFALANAKTSRARRRWTRSRRSERRGCWSPNCWPRSRSRTAPTPAG